MSLGRVVQTYLIASRKTCAGRRLGATDLSHNQGPLDDLRQKAAQGAFQFTNKSEINCLLLDAITGHNGFEKIEAK